MFLVLYLFYFTFYFFIMTFFINLITRFVKTLYVLYNRVFTFSNFLKVSIIFLLGLFSRYLVNHVWDVIEKIQKLLIRAFNSLDWGLNNPPKPHAFVSLSVQSELYSILSFNYAELSNVIPDICNVISNISNVILNILMPSISNVVSNISNAIPSVSSADFCIYGYHFDFTWILCMEAEPSRAQAIKSEHGLKSEIKIEQTDDNNNMITVDIGYIQSRTRTNRPYLVVYDRLDPTCNNLRYIYHRPSIKLVDLPEVGGGITGLNFPESRFSWLNSAAARSSRQFKENPVPRRNTTGIWITAPTTLTDKNSRYNVLSLGSNIEKHADGRSVLVLK